MKESQTFKFDPKLLRELKREAKALNRPFNNHVETILINRVLPIVKMKDYLKEFKK